MAAVLPDLPAPQSHDMPAGPTPWSNWVIPGRVLAGAYPASLDDVETEQLLTLLLELGVNTFVCLQAEVNIHIPEHSWRAGVGLRPYIRDAQRLLSRAQDTGSTLITQRKIDFLHLPIIDGSVTTDTAMSRLADDCCGRVLRGETLYIHCWGGHGRTGTLVAVMLGRLYDLSASSALRFTQGYHDSRVYPQGVRSPQTTVQRAQVKRLLLAPNPFAGITKAGGSSHISSNSSRPQQQQQQLPGSPLVSRPLAFSPATPAKQPVIPSVVRSPSRTGPAATSARVTGAPSETPAGTITAASAAAAAKAATPTSGSPAAGRHHLTSSSRSLSHSAAAGCSSGGGGSSTSHHLRLLQHQHTAPVSTAAIAIHRSGSGGSSSSFRGSSGGGGGNGGSSNSSRQQWPLAGALSPSAVLSSGSSNSSRAQPAASPLFRSDMLRTPAPARLAAPISHSSSVRRSVAVVDGAV